MDIYTEILYRLLTTKGLAWTTFTPLLGMSEVVMSFLEPENEQSGLSKYVVQAGWIGRSAPGRRGETKAGCQHTAVPD